MKEFLGAILFLFLGCNSIHANSTTSGTKPLWQLSPRQFFSSPVSQQPINLDSPDHYVLSISIFHATNELRGRFNLPYLTPMLDLHNAGESHLKSMVQHRFFGHDNPVNPSMQSVRQRVEYYGGYYNGIGENLAMVNAYKTKNGKYKYRIINNQYHFFDLSGRPLQVMTYGELGKKLVEEWYNSPGHRKNLLHDQFRYIGIATLISRADSKPTTLPSVYAIQDFAF